MFQYKFTFSSFLFIGAIFIYHSANLDFREEKRQKNEGTNVKKLVDKVFVKCVSVRRCRYPTVYMDISVLKFLIMLPCIFHQPRSPCRSGQKRI